MTWDKCKWTPIHPRIEAEKLGYRIVYVPHHVIKDYNACYRVIYQGKLISPPAAEKLGIPTNEIWLSEWFKNYEKYILFHELREIKHRAKGLNGEEAHKKALEDEKIVFEGDPEWELLRKEINLVSEENLRRLSGIGRTLAWRIMSNRPYDSMENLLKVPGIGKKRFEILKRELFCMGDTIMKTDEE